MSAFEGIQSVPCKNYNETTLDAERYSEVYFCYIFPVRCVKAVSDCTYVVPIHLDRFTTKITPRHLALFHRRTRRLIHLNRASEESYFRERGRFAAACLVEASDLPSDPLRFFRKFFFTDCILSLTESSKGEVKRWQFVSGGEECVCSEKGSYTSVHHFIKIPQPELYNI